MEFEPIAFDECKKTIDLFSRGNIPEVDNGRYICLLTNENNLAVLKIIKSKRGPSGIEITIEYRLQ